jgi:hypothetical protein
VKAETRGLHVNNHSIAAYAICSLVDRKPAAQSHLVAPTLPPSNRHRSTSVIMKLIVPRSLGSTTEAYG